MSGRRAEAAITSYDGGTHSAHSDAERRYDVPQDAG
jgi:hypothetical protein